MHQFIQSELLACFNMLFVILYGDLDIENPRNK